jgi:hypothetical protein
MFEGVCSRPQLIKIGERSVWFQGRHDKKERIKKKWYKCLHCSAHLTGRTTVGKHIRLTTDKQVSCVALCKDGLSVPEPQWAKMLSASNRIHMCSICGVELCGVGTVRNHEYTIHGIQHEKRYNCDECEFVGLTPWEVKRHKLDTHITVRGEVCDICGKSFRLRQDVKVHIRVVHKARRITCRFCPQKFTSRTAKENHERLHAGVKEFNCRFCQKAFAQKYNLRVHERIHTGVKPYQCHICSDSFAQRNSLDVHMMKHGMMKESKDGAKIKRGKTTLIPELAERVTHMLAGAISEEVDIISQHYGSSNVQSSSRGPATSSSAYSSPRGETSSSVHSPQMESASSRHDHRPAPHPSDRDAHIHPSERDAHMLHQFPSSIVFPTMPPGYRPYY